jgi:uncharacterized protein DUF4129
MMRGLLAIFVLLSLSGAVLAADGDPAPADSVKSAGDSLASTWKFPWYDSEHDRIRPVREREPSGGSQSLPNLPGAIDLFNLLVMVAAVLLLAALAYFLSRAYLRRENIGRPVPKPAAASPAEIAALPFELPTGATDLLSLARRHFAAGRFGDAIVYLFSHQLVELDRHQKIRLARGKTNRQYLRELRGKPELARLLELSLVAFEDFFFGNQPLDHDRADACWAAFAEFEQRLGASP